MKIVFSPSKEMREKEIISKDILLKVNTETILFPNKTDELLKTLKEFNQDEIAQIMKIKSELLSRTFENIKNYANLEKMSAISLYSGVAYKELEIQDYNLNNFKYISDKLLIFSAFYGLLFPFMEVKKYRLDMTMKLGQLNLYDFWKKTINNFLEKNLKDEIIVNLASGEFSKILDRKRLKNILNIDFKNYKDGEYKSISSYSKQARGKFLNFLIKKNICDTDNFKDITFDGYKINLTLSDENNYIYTRE